MLMLQFFNTKKAYAHDPIFEIPSLHLDAGVYWLQGINGSGKTTLLRMIAGMSPFEGDIIFDGISQYKQPLPYRKKISWAEAEPSYPPFITGKDLVLYYQEIRKATDQQIDKLIVFSGLQKKLADPIGTYSSGMVKRLSILLAFIGHVPLILLDEPLSTLDAEAVHTIPDLISEYRQQYGTSFIFSSHQPFLLETLKIDKKLVITERTIQLTP
jgi:ABC-2 type transport system ATP-binding protein